MSGVAVVMFGAGRGSAGGLGDSGVRQSLYSKYRADPNLAKVTSYNITGWEGAWRNIASLGIEPNAVSVMPTLAIRRMVQRLLTL